MNTVSWWMNEGYNIRSKFPSPVMNSKGLGHYANAVATGTKTKTATMKAFATFTQSFDRSAKVGETPDDGKEVGNQLWDSYIHRVTVSFMLPEVTDFQTASKVYNTWAVTFLDRRKHCDDFFSLCAPLAVNTAYSIYPLPKRVESDCRKYSDATMTKFTNVTNALERLCITKVMWFCSHMMAENSGAVSQYRSEITTHYDQFINIASRADWAKKVFPGTKYLTLAIHFARVYLGPDLGDQAEKILTVITSLHSQLQNVAIISKQVSVMAFMAFELVNVLLATLSTAHKKFFGRQLLGMQDWAQGIIDNPTQRDVFPEFHSVASEYMKASRLLHKNDDNAVGALKKAAANAKSNRFMLVYITAMMAVANKTKDKGLFADLEDSMENTGLSTYTKARIIRMREK